MRAVSVIVPSYNSYLTIGRTLESILNQNNRAINEIIVVDSSDDGLSREVISQYHERVQLIPLINRVSPAQARNLGAERAKGEILVFVDSDVVLSDGWIDKIIGAYENGKIIGCGGIILDETQANNWLAIGQYLLQFNEYVAQGKDRQKKFVPSCNLYCSKEIFEKAGGFPEIRASEDVLFCLKAGKYSDIWFIPEAKVKHIFRESWTGYFKNQIVLGKYILIYRRRESKGKFYYLWLWPLFLLPVIIMFKFCRIVLRILRSRPIYILKFIYSLPVFLAGLLFWGIGFTQGVFTDE